MASCTERFWGSYFGGKGEGEVGSSIFWWFVFRICIFFPFFF